MARRTNVLFQELFYPLHAFFVLDLGQCILHRTIARASGNLVAPQLAPIITASVEVFTEGTHRTLLQETLDTHKAVLEAIKCGDSTWARDAMTLHLSYNRDLYRKMHRARSGEPPLAPKVPEWVLQLKELTKPEEPEEKE